MSFRSHPRSSIDIFSTATPHLHRVQRETLSPTTSARHTQMRQPSSTELFTFPAYVLFVSIALLVANVVVSFKTLQPRPQMSQYWMAGWTCIFLSIASICTNIIYMILLWVKWRRGSIRVRTNFSTRQYSWMDREQPWIVF